MRVLICGDRNWTDEGAIFKRLHRLPFDTVIIVGGARGADILAERAARTMNRTGQKQFDIRVFPAQWETYGRAAGPIRNSQMLDEKPHLVIAFHSNVEVSKGTKNCVLEARRRKIDVEIITGNEE